MVEKSRQGRENSLEESGQKSGECNPQVKLGDGSTRRLAQTGTMNIETQAGTYPTSEAMRKACAQADKDCLEAVWGEGWRLFIAQNRKHYLEYDAGHLATKMVAVEISKADYRALEADPSRFNALVNRIDSFSANGN